MLLCLVRCPLPSTSPHKVALEFRVFFSYRRVPTSHVMIPGSWSWGEGRSECHCCNRSLKTGGHKCHVTTGGGSGYSGCHRRIQVNLPGTKAAFGRSGFEPSVTTLTTRRHHLSGVACLPWSEWLNFKLKIRVPFIHHGQWKAHDRLSRCAVSVADTAARASSSC